MVFVSLQTSYKYKMVKANYRINFLKPGRYGSDTVLTKDVYAKNSEDATRIGYNIASAGNLREKGVEEISVEEIPVNPCNIGIEFIYTDTIFKKDFHGYTFVYAENEEQAREYYNEHLKGTRFWFNCGEIDPTGKCVRGKIVATYFAGGAASHFNALNEKQTAR